MKSTSTGGKSCGVQHFGGLPSNDWELSKLEDFAKRESAAIDELETSAARIYWRLGYVLNLIRMQFTHGQWEAQLRNMQIEKTRAARAQRIYRNYQSEEQLQGATVKEAYENGRSAATEPTGSEGRAKTKSRRRGTTYRDAMKRITKGISDITVISESIPQSKRRSLLAAVEQLIQNLQELRTKLDP